MHRVKGYSKGIRFIQEWGIEIDLYYTTVFRKVLNHLICKISGDIIKPCNRSV